MTGSEESDPPWPERERAKKRGREHSESDEEATETVDDGEPGKGSSINLRV